MKAEGVIELFEVAGRHDDGPDLLAAPLEADAQEAFDRLSSVLDAHSTTLAFE